MDGPEKPQPQLSVESDIKMSYSQSSSFRPDPPSPARDVECEYGIPRQCRCGAMWRIGTSEDEFHKGRLFFVCARREVRQTRKAATLSML